jgi:hypothetical protein
LKFDWGGIQGHAGGNRVATLDNPNADASNFLILTIDAASVDAATDTLLLSFDVTRHGDENDFDDRVWVRGSDSDPWIQVFDVTTLSSTATAYIWGINLSDALMNDAPSQSFSSTTQVRFGQNDNFPYATDGASFDNIGVMLMPSTLTSTAPDFLLATMAEVNRSEVDNNSVVSYKVTIFNPESPVELVNPSNPAEGEIPQQAENVNFSLTNFASETSLSVGSVLPTQGTVVTGNAANDETISVDLGTIEDGEYVQIYFRANAEFKGSKTFTNQGSVSATDITTFLTDDPYETGVSDAALATFAPIEDPILNLNVTLEPQDPLFKTLTGQVTATPNASGSPLLFASLTEDVCEVVDDVVSILQTGTCSIEATQEATEVFAAASAQTDVEVTLRQGSNSGGSIAFYLALLMLVARKRRLKSISYHL